MQMQILQIQNMQNNFFHKHEKHAKTHAREAEQKRAKIREKIRKHATLHARQIAVK